MCSLRDAADQFKDLDVEVYGISLDSVVKQAAFVEKEELNFLLLSDPDASAAEKYGVLHPSKRFSSRVTFVIDDEGIVRHIDQQVSVQSHGADLVGVVRELQED